MSKNYFFVPQPKKIIFQYYWPLNFRKKFFFGFKKPMFKLGCGSQKSIWEHFFGCFRCPPNHMFISQNFFATSYFSVFWLWAKIFAQSQNTLKYEVAKKFWDMNIWFGGHLKHPKKCSQIDFWDPQPSLNIGFLKPKKNFFRKFRGQ